MHNVDMIRANNPLMETIEKETGLKWKKAGTWYQAKCPLHNDGETPSLSTKDNIHYYCFGCPPETNHGDIIDFIAHHKHMTFLEACEHLGGQSTTSLSELAQLETARKAEEELRLSEEAKDLDRRREEFATAGKWQTYHKNLNLQARAWWKMSGIPEDWQDFWKLGYVPDLWEHGPAYSIPYFGLNKKPMTMQYRWQKVNGLGKYATEKELGTYGFICRPDMKFDKLLLVEGMKKAGVCHILGTEAKMQTIGFWSQNNLGGQEIDDLISRARAVWFWPDPGDLAFSWAMKQIQRLGIASKTRIIRFHLKPDDALLRGMTSNQFQAILKSARRMG